MLSRGIRSAAACFLTGTFCLTLLPWILADSQLRYWQQEPVFACPIPTPPAGIKLRSDSYGKGHFGASRGNTGRREHLGADLAIKTGQPVFASKSGRVSYAGFDKGYGNYVQITHPDGFSTRYAHLSQLMIATGDWLPQGGMIGRTGKTGNANDKRIHPHLHFEVRYNGKAMDPAVWMRGLSK